MIDLAAERSQRHALSVLGPLFLFSARRERIGWLAIAAVAMLLTLTCGAHEKLDLAIVRSRKLDRYRRDVKHLMLAADEEKSDAGSQRLILDPFFPCDVPGHGRVFA